MKVGEVEKPRRLVKYLVVFVTIFVISCGAPGSGQFVVESSVNAEQPEIIYYALEERSPYGENETEEDPDGIERECLLLPFTKQTTMDPHGKHHYYSDKLTSTTWKQCKNYVAIDEPPLVVNSLPDVVAEELGIEVPKLIP